MGCLCKCEAVAIWDHTAFHRNHQFFQHQHKCLGCQVCTCFYKFDIYCNRSLSKSLFFFKGVVDCFFSRLDCVYGVQASMCSCLFFLKTHYFSHSLPLFHTSLSLLWQTPRLISWFYEAPPSEIRDGLRLVSWLSVLWLAKPPLLHVWTSRPSPQWHVLRLNCKQWRCL